MMLTEHFRIYKKSHTFIEFSDINTSKKLLPVSSFGIDGCEEYFIFQSMSTMIGDSVVKRNLIEKMVLHDRKMDTMSHSKDITISITTERDRETIYKIDGYKLILRIYIIDSKEFLFFIKGDSLVIISHFTHFDLHERYSVTGNQAHFNKLLDDFLELDSELGEW